MDIHHLRDIGEVDSFPLSIDSSLRDKRVHPTPADYEIEFDTPFTNVVGFDVLDATIPNTMYVVDSHNSLLSFAVSMPGGPEDHPGRRTLDACLGHLAQAPAFLSLWDDDRYPSLGIKMSGSLLPISQMDMEPDPGPATPVVVADSVIPLLPVPAPAAASGGARAMSIDPGAEYEVTTDGSSYFVRDFSAGGGLETVAAGPGARVLVCASRQSSDRGTTLHYATAPAADLLTSPLGNRHTTHVPRFEGESLVSVVSYGTFRVTSDFYKAMTNGDKGGVAAVNDPPVASNPFGLPVTTFHHELRLHNIRVELGNHDVASLVAALELAMPTYTPEGSGAGADGAAQPVISLVSTSAPGSDPSTPNFERKRKVRFESPFRFWMDMGKSTISDVIGFSELAPGNSPDHGVYRPGDNHSVFEALPFGGGGNVYAIETPGIVSLVGQRLVVLRCPQIEDHAFPSLSHGRFSAGLGVFKLYEKSVAHLRFDFTKLSRLDFHPIGKLPKLRLRFERIGGEVYNFKGVDHHIFLSVKFLSPRGGRALPPPASRLNPDYDPDVLRYRAERMEERDESDTASDDEILADDAHARRFFENRRVFLLREEHDAARGGSTSSSGSEPGSESGSSSGSESGSSSGSESGSESGAESPPRQP